MMVKKKLTFKGLKPKPWQKVVHDAISRDGCRAGKIYVVKAKRQIGKTVIIEQELIRHAINYAGSLSICLSLTNINCRKIYREIVKGCINSGIIEKNNDTLLEIEFINGSVILFKSAQQKEMLRGYTISRGGLLCIDEAAYISEDVFNIISPWTDVNNANTLMVSTPRLKTGTFYNMYQLGISHLAPNVESFDLCKFDTSEMLSPEKLELYRKTMPQNQFITEYLGEFVEDGGNVFDIKSIKWNKVIHNKMNETDGYEELYIGIDWGNGVSGDYTAIVGFDENGVQRLLSYHNTQVPKVQIEWLKNCLLNKVNPKKIRKIVAESNSIGTVYIDLLKDAIKPFTSVPIEEFTTTNSSKREIIENLITAIGEGKITLYDDEEQRREFSAYAMELTTTGKITYNAPWGLHDDIVMAVGMAYQKIKEVKTKSTYTISFGNRNRIKSLSEKYG